MTETRLWQAAALLCGVGAPALGLGISVWRGGRLRAWLCGVALVLSVPAAIIAAMVISSWS